jgi:hypothetical protein
MPCPTTDEAGRTDPVAPLEGQQGVRRELTADAVDWTRIEPVSPEPDLESGDASTGGEPARSERENANGHRDAEDGEATHGRVHSSPEPAILSRASRNSRLQSRRCLPR